MTKLARKGEKKIFMNIYFLYKLTKIETPIAKRNIENKKKL